ncbi:MAG: YeeE/YedE thiosulfate transporter family protein [Thermoanaerobaculia bacterium]
MSPARAARPYADPYLAGVGLGSVLLASYVVVGRGLGASGAFASSAAGLVAALDRPAAEASPLFSRYLGAGGPWREWLLFEIAGVAIGGFLSALVAGRLRREVERGAGVSRGGRLAMAAAGGAIMGAGAVLARGCTSGQALTGGALLAVGSWIFLAAAFAAAFAIAPLLRRSWR